MKPLIRLIVLMLLFAPPASTLASPGAHGPNGEHLDSPTANSAASADGRPRAEGFSEMYEVVAHLEHDAVTAMFNVYRTNAPADGMSVELKTGGVAARSKFDPASGVYRFSDPALLKALSAPGKHSLEFTVTAGDDFDIVGAMMEVAAPADAHAAGARRWYWVAGLLAAVVVVGFALGRLRPARRFAGARA